MSLSIGTILQVATLVTVIAGLTFGVLEVRRASRERADKGALDVLSISVRPEHIAASYAILDLPEDASSTLVLRSPRLRAAANTLMVQYEYLGILEPSISWWGASSEPPGSACAGTSSANGRSAVWKTSPSGFSGSPSV
jgi:hypothetical protein